MKIGIVGGTGNISTSIVRLLLKQGHEVVCFNRGPARHPASRRSARAGRPQGSGPPSRPAMQQEHFDAAIDMICFTAEDAESSLRAFRGVGTFVMCSTVCTYGVDYDWLAGNRRSYHAADHPVWPQQDRRRQCLPARLA